jgi:phosphoglycerate dehydrogenase-like enzyme
MTTRPRVALGPEGTRTFLVDAVRAGGGEVVDLADAEALVWTDPHDPARLSEVLARHPSIRWVQLPWAGIEPMAGVIDHERVWTAGKGVYAEEVAEHALALALAGLRNLGPYARATTWTGPTGQNLLGARVTLLGAGGIATSFLRLLAPFGCTVTVLRRIPEPLAGVARTGTLAELVDVAGQTDLLVIALALTEETTGIVDAEVLDVLPPDAWVVNVARGRHVVTDDLVDALRHRRIGGAGLDVTDPEPLPPGHPLWSLPNCIITPHTANTPEMAVPVLSRRVEENVRRFARGEPLLGPVDVGAGY